jgi:hypothetical protein
MDVLAAVLAGGTLGALAAWPGVLALCVAVWWCLGRFLWSACVAPIVPPAMTATVAAAAASFAAAPPPASIATAPSRAPLVPGGEL